MTRYDDDQYVQEQYEISRRLEIAAEQEPAWMHRKRRNRYLGRNRPGPERRYFSRLMFKPIPTEPVADETTMSYIAGCEAPQGRVDDGAGLGRDEGRAATRSGLGAADAQSARGAGAGAVPGVAA